MQLFGKFFQKLISGEGDIYSELESKHGNIRFYFHLRRLEGKFFSKVIPKLCGLTIDWRDPRILCQWGIPRLTQLSPVVFQLQHK